VPVVAMSASPRYLGAAETAGLRAVLAKPFGVEELLAAVAGCCARH
jgi:CheY-like chemotaxis protein